MLAAALWAAAAVAVAVVLLHLFALLWPILAVAAAATLVISAVLSGGLYWHYVWTPARQRNRRLLAGRRPHNRAPAPRETEPVDRPQHPEAYGLDPEGDD